MGDLKYVSLDSGDVHVLYLLLVQYIDDSIYESRRKYFVESS